MDRAAHGKGWPGRRPHGGVAVVPPAAAWYQKVLAKAGKHLNRLEAAPSSVAASKNLIVSECQDTSKLKDLRSPPLLQQSYKEFVRV